MSTDQTPESAQTAAAREGADVEVTSADRSGGVPHVQLDRKTLQAGREALPGWNVQPDELVRTVTVPAGAAALRASLEQVASDAGRLPEITVSGDQVTMRLRSAGGPPPALLELAAALAFSPAAGPPALTLAPSDRAGIARDVGRPPGGSVSARRRSGTTAGGRGPW